MNACLSSRIALQVEIKLRLPTKEAHDEVAEQLKDSFRETHQQENFFFDGANGELSSQRVVLRCRFYNHDKRAIVTLKVLAHCTQEYLEALSHEKLLSQHGWHTTRIPSVRSGHFFMVMVQHIQASQLRLLSL